jgi:hypothetical protein
MAKANKSSIRKQKKTRTTPLGNPFIFHEFLNVKTWEHTIVTESVAKQWAIDFLDYATNDEPSKKAYNVCDFYIKRGIPRDAFMKAVDIFPELKAAYQVGLEAIGSRRSKGSMYCEGFKPLNDRVVNFTQYQYDPSWKEAEEYHDERKRKQIEDDNKTGGKEYIILKPGEDCPEVPKKDE